MPASVLFSNLEKRFYVEKRVTQALRGVSGHIKSGKITGLVGPDGAGKTTLIRLLAGLLSPDNGTINLQGSPSPRIAYMPQRFGLYEDLTVAENLSLYADLNGLDSQSKEIRFSELHRFTGLGPFASRLAGKLSGGMKQKLGLACTMVAAPDILLLDEPSVGVDPISRRELWAMVRELQNTGIAVLWSTAYLDEAERCDYVILLHDGQVLSQGSPLEFSNRMQGLTWSVTLPDSVTSRKRDIQRDAAQIPLVVDAQIRGKSLRIVMSKENTPPNLEKSNIHAIKLLKPELASPHFEDAYLAALREQLKTNTVVSHNSSVAPHTLDKRSSSSVIEVHELTRRFGQFTAVDHVSFSVRHGEIFGLMGPNGAGKSTTFKMLCGLLPASEGDALVAGYDLRHARADARSRIGYMAQKFSHLGHLTVRQNMRFAAGIYGLSGETLLDKLTEATQSYGLANYLEVPCTQLPLGIKQRMALACAVMHKPKILFLDEPTSGVDPITRREFWDRINAMADDGVTVLVTSHFLDEAEYCDRLVIIYRGNLIATGSPTQIKTIASKTGAGITLEEAFISLIEAYDLSDRANAK